MDVNPADDDHQPVPTPRFRQILLRATAAAQTRRDNYVGVEHLLLAIIYEDQSLAAHALRRAGNRDQVLEILLDMMDRSRPDLRSSSGDPQTGGPVVPD